MEYSSVLIFFIIGFTFAFISMFIVHLLSPKNPNQGAKQEIYECGEEVLDLGGVNFNIRYYVFALTFFVFDMEAIFLYPWAVSYQAMGLYGLLVMFMFLVVLGFGLLYAFKKDALKWV